MNDTTLKDIVSGNVSNVGKDVNIWEGQTGSIQTVTVFDVATTNMTRVIPKVTVSDSKLQAKLDDHWIGCKGLEYEAPHVTIISTDDLTARVRLRDRSLMPGSKGDSDVIEAVQADILNDPNKYIKNWNENNSEHTPQLDTVFHRTDCYRQSVH